MEDAWLRLVAVPQITLVADVPEVPQITLVADVPEVPQITL